MSTRRKRACDDTHRRLRRAEALLIGRGNVWTVTTGIERAAKERILAEAQTQATILDQPVQGIAIDFTKSASCTTDIVKFDEAHGPGSLDTEAHLPETFSTREDLVKSLFELRSGGWRSDATGKVADEEGVAGRILIDGEAPARWTWHAIRAGRKGSWAHRAVCTILSTTVATKPMRACKSSTIGRREERRGE